MLAWQLKCAESFGFKLKKVCFKGAVKFEGARMGFSADLCRCTMGRRS